MELLEVYGFRPNWLDAIAENCNREIAQGVLNLCRLLQDRQWDVDRLKYSLSMFGIVDSQWAKAGEPPMSDPDPLGLRRPAPSRCDLHQDGAPPSEVHGRPVA